MIHLTNIFKFRSLKLYSISWKNQYDEKVKLKSALTKDELGKFVELIFNEGKSKIEVSEWKG